MLGVFSTIIPRIKRNRINRQRDARHLSGVDWLMIFFTLATIGSSGYWKVQGPIILILFSAFCCIYIIYGAIFHKILLRNWLLFLWSIVGILHVGLSLLKWLPGTPVFFREEYVLRMGYFSFIVYPATAAFYLLFKRVRAANKLDLLAHLNIIGMILAAIVLYIFPAYDGVWRTENDDLNFITHLMSILNYGIDNISILLLWGLILISTSHPIALICVVIFMLFSNSAQMNLAAGILAALSIYPKPLRIARALSIIIVIGFPLAAFALVVSAKDLGIDPNTIHRAIWWVDALQAVNDNYGFGYGFGADSARDVVLSERFLMEGKWSRLPIHVIHNEYIYIFYSMGVVGGALFIAFHIKDLRPSIAYDRRSALHATFMFLVICLTTSVNVALTSPSYLLGLCWVYGFLLELNQKPPRKQRKSIELKLSTLPGGGGFN